MIRRYHVVAIPIRIVVNTFGDHNPNGMMYVLKENEQKVKEALAVFEMNYKKFKGEWPTNAGLMRGYSAAGDLKKALEHGNKALAQAPSEEIKKIIANAVETLSKGKAL